MSMERFETLVHAHQAELFRYVRFLGAQHDEAEDVVQDTFLAVFEQCGAQDTSDARLTVKWLRAVARNTFLKYCRSQRRSRLLVDSRIVAQAEQCWQASYLRDGDGFDYHEALRRCFGKLSEKHRSILDMRYGKGMSRATMASEARMTQDGIKSLLRRLRTALMKCIRAELGLDAVS